MQEQKTEELRTLQRGYTYVRSMDITDTVKDPGDHHNSSNCHCTYICIVCIVKQKKCRHRRVDNIVAKITTSIGKTLKYFSKGQFALFIHIFLPLPVFSFAFPWPWSFVLWYYTIIMLLYGLGQKSSNI